MTSRKSQVEKVYQVLSRSSNKPMSVQTLTNKTGLSREAVYRRVYDLRQEGLPIARTAKTVKGTKTSFYTLVSSVA